MKRLKVLIAVISCLGIALQAQPPGYYNGIEGKAGDELKTALNDIISGHVDFSYSDAKYVMMYVDQDPAISDNVIEFYTRRSQSATGSSDWGTGGDYLNREHVWAKSHGDFSDKRPMDGDVFNLHPADASVNITRSNYDFDECSETGTFIAEADAYYASPRFEPSDEVKGRVARTLFYMATRYEGNDGELDLQMADAVDVSPAAQHGKLSTLLQWNNDFPPDDHERRRNERMYQVQGNRNPFIDQPDLANLIWGSESSPVISIGNVELDPLIPTQNESVTFSAEITSSGASVSQVTLYWGDSYDSEANNLVLTQNGDIWSEEFSFSAITPGEFAYMKVVSTNGSETSVRRSTYKVPVTKETRAISSVQGTGETSPLNGSEVTISGIVTANFDGSYYLQDSRDPRSGICIYDVKRGKLGDSLVITGTVDEYKGLTELKNLSYHYNYGQKGRPEPIELSISEINEDYEGALVKIKGASFVGGETTLSYDATTLTLQEGGSQIPVYVRYNSRMCGQTIPGGTVDVVAVVSVYNDYQLLIDNIEDIIVGNDNEAPEIVSVSVLDGSWIEVFFNEKLDKTTAEDLSNYSVDGDVVIKGAYLSPETKVSLWVSNLKNQDYTLTVSGIKDLVGNTMDVVQETFHSDVVGIEELTIENDVRLYPVPANSTLHIVSSQELYSVELINIDGRVLEFERGISALEYQLNISDALPGLYFVALETELGKSIHKILIE